MIPGPAKETTEPIKTKNNANSVLKRAAFIPSLSAGCEEIFRKEQTELCLVKNKHVLNRNVSSHLKIINSLLLISSVKR